MLDGLGERGFSREWRQLGVATEEAGYAKFVEQRDQALAIVVLSVDLSLLYLIG